MYKKVKSRRSLNNPKRKILSYNDEMYAYDEIISRAKNTIDIFHKQLEQTIPSIISHENNITNIKNVNSVRNVYSPSINKNNKQNYKSARDLSSNSIYYQPILTDLGNVSNTQVSHEDANENINNNNSINKININSNVDEYYKNLYKK